jgi:hypothetical protein
VREVDLAARRRLSFNKAAAGADPASVSIALQLVLMLETVDCRPK